MIRVNIRATGQIGIYCKGMQEIKKIPKECVQQELERMQFDNKECQRDIEKLNTLIAFVHVIGLTSKKEKEIGIYVSPTSFGRKRPEITITGNYPLYNMLRKLIE